MSISKFQDKLFKGGCGVAVLMVCAGVMVGGVFYSSCVYGRQNGPSVSNEVAFKIGGTPIDPNMLQDGARALMQGTGPAAEEDATEQALARLTDQGANRVLLEKSGYKPDDATVLQQAQKKIDEDIEMERMRAQMGGRLKPNASDADWEQYVKQLSGGKTVAEIKAAYIANTKKELADPDQREKVLDEFTHDFLLEAVKAKHPVSEAELEASYASYQFKKLLVQPEVGAGPVETRLAAAQKDIAKGVPFEKVIDTYTSEKPIGTKKPSENTVDMSKTQLDSDPNMKALESLKPGQTSGIVTAPDGKAIYKLIAIKPNLPADFDKGKDRYRKEYLDRIVGPEVDDQIKKLKETPGFVTPEKPGYKAFYDYCKLKEATPGGKPDVSKLQPIYDEAAKASGSSDFDARIASITRFVVETSIWNDPKTDKAKARQARIDTINDVLRNYEDVDLRLELADLYSQAKQNDNAAASLLAASENNTDYGTTGFDRFGRIRDALQKMQLAKTITDDQVKKINDAQLDWSRERAEQEKEKEEAKKQQAAADAEMKRQHDAAEAARKAAEKAKASKPAAVPPKGQGTATTGLVPGPTTPAPGSKGDASKPVTVGISKPTAGFGAPKSQTPAKSPAATSTATGGTPKQ